MWCQLKCVERPVDCRELEAFVPAAREDEHCSQVCPGLLGLLPPPPPRDPHFFRAQAAEQSSSQPDSQPNTPEQ